MSERIHARYIVETADEPRRAVEVMAGEQSSGTFVAVPGETADIRERSGARIESLTVVEDVDAPSLPGARAGRIYHRCAVELSWPLENLGPSLPNLVATVAGNLFELKQFSGLRIVDIDLPRAFATRYEGPQFGIEGTRRLSGVADGPLIGTIVKPSVGLTPEATADLVDTLAGAGIDFIKDDELQSDGPACPFEARARMVMAVIDRHADRTGKKVMFAFNVTGDLDEMRRRHDLVLSLGGTCVMASLNSVGLVGMIELRRHAALPIHAHRNGWGYLSRAPMLGWDYPAWSKLWRLAGADHMHVNGIRNKFCEEDASVVRSAKSLLAPMFPDKPCVAMPVFSSGQTAAQAADTWRALGGTDLIYAAGGGIMAHPDGIAAGVRGLRQAWEAAASGIDAEAYAKTHPEFRVALEALAR
ncbi:MAG: ribulose-bisphosphate carboxylase large subunit family protein [Bauldia sp.]|uniref:ribulose-bisphosphate carboxylase large subunit family protein n=1 Tax=Bauldia sp. TaxID=2575872 RepID=UPI001D4B4D70|nr:ribulose-bisphosphate carboxylase large subunit family protein [Bauldia sp.]MCB1486946.1 ribulose-bisphosphate carboxylase large subunit family protein [Bauldia sp.]MCB1495503.1 ribulose-bisphosphate carboxylase large subunit family protein [Bauldia sp.]